MRYIMDRCSKAGIFLSHTLSGTVKNCLNLIDKLNGVFENKFFISDTHFSSKRILELSLRPFQSFDDMDWSMVKNWNIKISKNDIVYHLGDFGNPDFISHLNGKEIYLIRGNYDDDITISKLRSDNRVRIVEYEHLLVDINGVKCELIHQPNKSVSDVSNPYFWLFGHIHKLQMVKRNGLNVSVDCHNFRPDRY